LVQRGIELNQLLYQLVKLLTVFQCPSDTTTESLNKNCGALLEDIGSFFYLGGELFDT
jgi:hypothetical protein